MKRELLTAAAQFSLLAAVACGGLEQDANIDESQADTDDALSCSAIPSCANGIGTRPPRPTVTLADGMTVQEAFSTDVYYLWGHAKWKVGVDPQNWQPVDVVPNGTIGAQGFGTQPVDGTIILDNIAGEWVFIKGHGFKIELSDAYNWPTPHWIPTGSAQAMPLVYYAASMPNGFVFRDHDKPEVYVIQAYAKFWIPDPTELVNYYGGWSNVAVLPTGYAPNTPNEPFCGSLFQERFSSTQYVIMYGWKYAVTNPSTLMGYEPVHVVPAGDLGAFATAGYPAPEYFGCIN